jgi:hypothetical protein
MNWIMLPVLVVYALVVWAIRDRIKKFILQEMVRTKILKQLGGYKIELMLAGYHLVAAFVLLPVLFLTIALLFNNIPYSYSWLYSIVAYGFYITSL